MQLTARDVSVLEHVHAYRLLTREQIERLLFPGVAPSVSKRRLTLLFHHGYLGRIALPLRNAYGAARAVYHATPRALGVLALHARIEQPERLRRDHEREELFLRHTLAINDVRIGMSLATASAGYELLWWDEQELRRRGVRARLQNRQSTLRVLPDAYFVITAGGVADGFALELDRGTVSEQRMRARFRAYGEWAAAGTYRRELPCESLRVLIVADRDCDRGRLARLKRWCEDERGGSRFLFAELDALVAASSLTSQRWLAAGDDQPRPITLRGAL